MTDVNQETAEQIDAKTIEKLGVHVYALTAAVRALFATHPNRDETEATFHALIAQMQAAPVFLQNKHLADSLRDFSETVLQRPVPPETSDQDFPPFE